MGNEFESITEFHGKKMLNAFHKGEKPKTDFKDSSDSVRVALLNYSPSVYEDMFWFIMGSYGNEANKRKQFTPSEEDIEKVIEACLNREAMPLALEIPKFTFVIWGIDRIITHQIVRNRIGVVYSQHCTGDNDIRHVDFLLPHRMIGANTEDEVDFRMRVKEWHRVGKALYAEGIDVHGYSMQDMRHMMPQDVDTYVMMSCNYMMLQNFVGRRLCSNETMQIQRVAELIKEEVTKVYPFLGRHLMSNCDRAKRCHFKKNGTIFGGSVYYPCGKYPWSSKEAPDPEAFIHPMTSEEIRQVENPAYRHLESEQD